MKMIPNILATIALALGMQAGLAQAGSPIWQQDWIIQSPPTFGPIAFGRDSDELRYSIDFDTGGDLLVSSLSYHHFSSDLFRLGGDGSMRWSASVGVDSGFDPPRIFSAIDGGAYITSEYLDALTRLDSSGSIVWTRRVPAQSVVSLSGGRTIVGACTVMTALMQKDGQIQWQLRIPNTSTSCGLSGLLVVDGTDVYLSINNVENSPANGSRVMRLDDAGQVLWSHSIEQEAGRLIGVDEVRVYFTTGEGISALDAATGQVLWQSTPVAGDAVLVPGSPAAPVIAAANTIQGIDPVTGIVRWTQPIVANDRVAAVGGSLMVETAAGLVKLDPVSGVIGWTTPLPSDDAFGNPISAYLAVGGLANGRFLAVGHANAPASQPPPFIVDIDFLSGQLIGVLPVDASPKGVSGISAQVGARIVSMAAVQGEDAARYRLEATSGVDGSQLWSRLDPPLDPVLSNSGYGPYFEIAVDQGVIAASIVEGGFLDANIGVAMWSEIDGTPRWRTAFGKASERWYDFSASKPVIDVGANVLVSMGTWFLCDPPNQCSKEIVYKLRSSDGAILWQHLQSRVTSGGLMPFIDAPRFVPISGDVVMEEDNAILRLDGANGTTVWTSDASALAPVSLLRVATDGNIIAVGANGWGKLDASTGNVLWSAQSPMQSCAPALCFALGRLGLSNGDVLEYGYAIAPGTTRRPFAAVLHTDGSGAIDLWFPESGSPTEVRFLGAHQDDLGDVWIRLRDSLVGAGSYLYSMARLNLADGTLGGRQILGSYTLNPLGASRFPTKWLAPPESDRLTVSTLITQSPLGDTEGLALLDTSMAAQGNLSIEASVSPTPGMPGESAHFRVTFLYSGSGTIESAHADVRLPWGGGIGPVTCSVPDGATCGIDARDGDLHLDFPIRPGDEVVLEGMQQIADNDVERSWLSALVFGPTGLVEQNTADNFLAIPVARSLFHGGFEP